MGDAKNRPLTESRDVKQPEGGGYRRWFFDGSTVETQLTVEYSPEGDTNDIRYITQFVLHTGVGGPNAREFVWNRNGKSRYHAVDDGGGQNGKPKHSPEPRWIGPFAVKDIDAVVSGLIDPHTPLLEDHTLLRFVLGKIAEYRLVSEDVRKNVMTYCETLR